MNGWLIFLGACLWLLIGFVQTTMILMRTDITAQEVATDSDLRILLSLATALWPIVTLGLIVWTVAVGLVQGLRRSSNRR